MTLFVMIVASLYFGREVLVPITLALLLAFLLTPLVTLLRRLHLGHVPSVLLALIMALSVILAIGGVTGSQIAQLSTSLPQYVVTTEAKIDGVRAYTVGRLAQLADRIGSQRSKAANDAPMKSQPAAKAPASTAWLQGGFAPFSLLVESESLLNDGAAAVGFGVLTVVAAGGSTSALTIAGSLAWTIAGGVVVGGLVAGLLLLVAGRTVDHLVEITLTTIAAYGSFLLAEHFGLSGVLASLTAGLLVGNVGLKGAISESGRDHVLSFWQYAAFLANSVIFIMIGGHEAHQPIAHFSGAVAIAIALVLIGRVLAVYPLCLLLIPTPLRIGLGYQHVLVWGGLRGALALALALALPENIPERQEIIVVAFAVVAFSILVQGLSMPRLIRSLGFTTGQIKQQ